MLVNAELQTCSLITPACLSDHLTICEVKIAISKGLLKASAIRILRSYTECPKADGQWGGVACSCITRPSSEETSPASLAVPPLPLQHFILKSLKTFP